MSHATADREEPSRRFGVMWLVLAAALAGNALLGPLAFDLVEYPLPETLRNQTIGLEVVTLVLVVPMCLAAGLLALRGHQAAGALGFGPAGYAAYMSVQYVLGPEYGHYAAVVPLQLAIFSLGGAMAIWAWNAVSVRRLPSLSRQTERRHGIVLLAVAGFVLVRYAGALAGFVTGTPIATAYAETRTFYWSIFLLDLGVVVPATVVAAIALFTDAPYAGTALYAVVGWFALVPPSVAAMAVVMLVNDDPNGSVAQVVTLGVASLLFGWWAVLAYRPLFGRSRAETPDATDGQSAGERSGKEATSAAADG